MINLNLPDFLKLGKDLNTASGNNIFGSKKLSSAYNLQTVFIPTVYSAKLTYDQSTYIRLSRLAESVFATHLILQASLNGVIDSKTSAADFISIITNSTERYRNKLELDYAFESLTNSDYRFEEKNGEIIAIDTTVESFERDRSFEIDYEKESSYKMKEYKPLFNIENIENNTFYTKEDLDILKNVNSKDNVSNNFNIYSKEDSIDSLPMDKKNIDMVADFRSGFKEIIRSIPGARELIKSAKTLDSGYFKHLLGEINKDKNIKWKDIDFFDMEVSKLVRVKDFSESVLKMIKMDDFNNDIKIMEDYFDNDNKDREIPKLKNNWKGIYDKIFILKNTELKDKSKKIDPNELCGPYFKEIIEKLVLPYIYEHSKPQENKDSSVHTKADDLFTRAKKIASLFNKTNKNKEINSNDENFISMCRALKEVTLILHNIINMSLFIMENYSTKVGFSNFFHSIFGKKDKSNESLEALDEKDKKKDASLRQNEEILSRVIPSRVKLQLKKVMNDGSTPEPINIFINVKSTPHVLSSEDMSLIFNRYGKDHSLFLNLIKLTTGEIQFFRDFIFQMKDMEQDLEFKRKHGETSIYHKITSNKIVSRLFSLIPVQIKETIKEIDSLINGRISKNTKMKYFTLITTYDEIATGFNVDVNIIKKNKQKYVNEVVDKLGLWSIIIADSFNGSIAVEDQTFDVFIEGVPNYMDFTTHDLPPINGFNTNGMKKFQDTLLGRR